MKVIIIKQCKEGNIHDVIEVKDGYGKNFLIKNGFAKPYNKFTQKDLKHVLQIEQEEKNHKVHEANELKNKIEKIQLLFSLPSSNGTTHGSITKKMIYKKLEENNIHLDSHAITSIKIAKIGESKISVQLFNKIIAKLNIIIKQDKK